MMKKGSFIVNGILRRRRGGVIIFGDEESLRGVRWISSSNGKSPNWDWIPPAKNHHHLLVEDYKEELKVGDTKDLKELKAILANEHLIQHIHKNKHNLSDDDDDDLLVPPEPTEEEIERLKRWNEFQPTNPQNQAVSLQDMKWENVETIHGVELTCNEVQNILGMNGGENIQAINATDVNDIWDFRVSCTSKSTAHSLKLARSITKSLKDRGLTTYKRSKPILGTSSGCMVVDMARSIVLIYHEKSPLLTLEPPTPTPTSSSSSSFSA